VKFTSQVPKRFLAGRNASMAPRSNAKGIKLIGWGGTEHLEKPAKCRSARALH